ncbi:MAG: sigma-54-dependent Fis family transcriptional regulator, partial [Planctomycetota bacterium]
MKPSTLKDDNNQVLLAPEEVKILIVDDNPSHGETLQEAMEKVGYQVELATSGEEALNKLDEKEIDIVITDLKIDETSGMDILKKSKALEDPPEVILITGYASVETAVEAMREGALDYLEKPINLKVLRAKVAKAVERLGLKRANRILQKQLEEKFYFEGIVGRSPKMKRVIEKLKNLAPNSDTTVLITGENGTGKELVAKTIHNNSSRKKFPFVVI